MSPLDVPIALTLLALSALAFVLWFGQALRRARRARDVEVLSEPLGDNFLAEWECRVSNCDRAASVWVVQRPFGVRMFVCRTCAHDGAALGWWALDAS